MAGDTFPDVRMGGDLCASLNLTIAMFWNDGLQEKDAIKKLSSSDESEVEV
jgi:hypothetical protein